MRARQIGEGGKLLTIRACVNGQRKEGNRGALAKGEKQDQHEIGSYGEP